MASRIHHAQLVSRRSLATDTIEYGFQVVPEEPAPIGGTPASDAAPGSATAPARRDEVALRFRPGQFVSVQVGTDDNDNPILRSYSIATRVLPPGKAPQGVDMRQWLSIVLRLVPGGAGSQYFARLADGDRIRFTGPMGFFVNELQHGGDAVYVATGTGIAPILPMMQETLERPEPGRVLLYWGLRNEEDLFWQDEIAALGRYGRFSSYIYLSQPRTGWTRLRGRVTGPVLEAVPTLRAPTFYLCGNGKMIEELKAALISRGVDRKRQIRTEAFFD